MTQGNFHCVCKCSVMSTSYSQTEEINTLDIKDLLEVQHLHGASRVGRTLTGKTELGGEKDHGTNLGDKSRPGKASRHRRLSRPGSDSMPVCGLIRMKMG